MDAYNEQIHTELAAWQQQMLQRPTFFNRLSKSMQVKMNSWIPEKVHRAITVTIKQMISGVLFGANYTTPRPMTGVSLQEREAAIGQRKILQTYRCR